MDFWTRLRNAIKQQNTTQEWVAGKIGVPLSTFRKWMTRKTYPDLRDGIEIAKLLETSAEYLITGIEPKDLNKELNEKEIKLINAYRILTPMEQENAVVAILAWAEKRKRWIHSQ